MLNMALLNEFEKNKNIINHTIMVVIKVKVIFFICF